MDQALRRLQRDRAQGPEHEARHLRARLRRGELSLERLRLAALLSHAPATEVLAEEAPEARPPQTWQHPGQPPENWGARARVEALARTIGEGWGREAFLRASLAAAEHVLPVWEERSDDDPRPRRCLQALRRYLDQPSDTHHRAVAEAVEEANRGPGAGRYDMDVNSAREAAINCALAAGTQGIGSVLGHSGIFHACLASPDPTELISAIERALVSWALDPPQAPRSP